MSSQPPKPAKPPQYPTKIVVMRIFAWRNFLWMLGVIAVGLTMFTYLLLAPSLEHHPFTPAQTIEVLEFIAVGVLALTGINILLIFLDARIYMRFEKQRQRSLEDILSKASPQERAGVELILSKG